MSIPFLITLGIPVLLAPIWTHGIFWNVYKVEEKQIFLDNRAIEIGRSDRLLFNLVRSMNSKLRALEIPHHVAHLCRFYPATAIQCAIQDKIMEKQVRVLHQLTGRLAQSLWTGTTERIRSQLRGRNTDVVLQRENTVPLVAKRCSICGLETQWEVSQRGTSTRLISSTPKQLTTQVRMRGKSLRIGAEWNYFLENGDGQVHENK